MHGDTNPVLFVHLQQVRRIEEEGKPSHKGFTRTRETLPNSPRWMSATACQPHGSDYQGGLADWNISLSELLRGIQFYNMRGYYRCLEDSEDGYCAGT